MGTTVAQERYDLRLQVRDSGVRGAQFISERYNLLLQHLLAVKALIKFGLVSVRRRVSEQRGRGRGRPAAPQTIM